jgi:DNA polymerase
MPMAGEGEEFLGERPGPRGRRPSAATLREALRRTAFGCGDLVGPGATQIVPGEGNALARIVIVGEAPGEEEDRLGRPFVGRSGKLLDQVLATAGLERRDLWITNAVKARPVAFEDGRARNRAPTAAEVKAWRSCLEEELTLIRPSLVVGLGAVAGKALVGKDFRITAERGNWHKDSLLGLDVLVTWHPSYIMRQSGEDYRARLGEAIADFERVRGRLLDKP